ncbi:hypothetical protein [Helicobacter mehlei]|uniref:hypothetical protein n=1 Tax=Helicobacter mehlei TaxID=2316080 RepID=UPI000EACD881|nr:hypothetical protein [Helicobacter mehlei]
MAMRWGCSRRICALTPLFASISYNAPFTQEESMSSQKEAHRRSNQRRVKDAQTALLRQNKPDQFLHDDILYANALRGYFFETSCGL